MLLVTACLGAGAVALHATDMWRGRDLLDRSAIAFGIGFGVFGWLLFWLGTAQLLDSPVLWILAVLFSLGNILHWSVTGERTKFEPLNRWSGLALASILAVLAIDLVEALSPPVEADTLAYHFTLPRQFVETGGVFFQPVAFSGAIPLLVHMTYAAAISLGQELGLTLWVFVTAWGTAILLFAVVRRWISDAWAISLVLLFMTMPATVYGGGTGQVEVRLALFVIIAGVGLMELNAGKWWQPILLVGVGVGLFLGGKLTGVFFATAIGIVFLMLPGPRIKRLTLFCVLTVIFGGQWYAWNFVHTGDPLFPMLFDFVSRLDLARGDYWNAAHESIFREYLAARGSVVEGFHWLFTYPIVATLFPPSQFGSGRIGFGPFFLLAAPLAAVAVWTYREKIAGSRLFPVALVIVGFYVLWITLGGIPKVRHVLPVVPLLLICFLIPVVRSQVSWLKRPLAIATMLSVSVGLGAQALYGMPLLSLQFGFQDRANFLRQNVMSYSGAELVNNLTGVSKVYLWDRQLQYYITHPTFFASPYGQTNIQSAEGYVEFQNFYQQLLANDVSHILSRRPMSPPEPKSPAAAIVSLADLGCLQPVGSAPYNHFNSRTLKSIWNSSGSLDVWRVSPTCDRLK